MRATWIDHPLELKGRNITLIPLEAEHIDELISLAQQKEIWTHYAVDGSDPDTLRNSLMAGLSERDPGLQYPFIIFHQQQQKIIGSTRFLEINPLHSKLEIGWTWLPPHYWGKGINEEAKLLLLQYCFEILKAVRVQLKTDENNIRSRKAILKIGAKFEGILRNDMIRSSGTSRNSAYFSIINTEWREVKEVLRRLRGGF